jgi:hypothetical protein
MSTREFHRVANGRPASPSEIRARIDGQIEDRRVAQLRKRAPVAVDAEALVLAALESRGLPDAAREYLETQSVELGDLIRRGREITDESAATLAEYILAHVGA